MCGWRNPRTSSGEPLGERDVAVAVDEARHRQAPVDANLVICIQAKADVDDPLPVEHDVGRRRSPTSDVQDEATRQHSARHCSMAHPGGGTVITITSMAAPQNLIRQPSVS